MTEQSIAPTRTRKPKAARPRKPYAAFPLSPHATGKWQKKIKGHIHYFGQWGHKVDGVLVRLPGDGIDAALKEYNAVAEDLHAGRTPAAKAEGMTLHELCNRFLSSKAGLLQSAELSQRTFADYKRIATTVLEEFGPNRVVTELQPDDFERLRKSFTKNCGPVRVGNNVKNARVLFNYAEDLLQAKIRYGKMFKGPSKKVLRQHRATKPVRMFDADQMRTLVEKASQPLKAMILLAMNCAFGNSDIAQLTTGVIDFRKGWVAFPRPKTGVARRCLLWPETIAAVQEALPQRPKHRDYEDADLVFLTRCHNRWVRMVPKATDANDYTPIDSISLEFGKLLRLLRFDRQGLGFYAIRHTFRTIADETLDAPAVRTVMGHLDDNEMDNTYRERVDDKRLRAVSDYVRHWYLTADKSDSE